jgi:ABC-type glycerol-3-phosphate transport system permease component
MSQQLTVCLIAIAANLVGVSIIYAILAQALTRMVWSGRGMFSAIALIIVGQLFWIVPALLIVVPRDPDGPSSYALWFGNWLVSGFAIVLFLRRATSIPRSLDDSARTDGLGAFGTWRHVIFPFVRRDLGLVALFTVMATLLPFWAFVSEPNTGNSIVIYQRFLSPQGRLAMMAAVSLIGALPLLAVFFLTSGRSPALAPE